MSSTIFAITGMVVTHAKKGDHVLRNGTRKCCQCNCRCFSTQKNLDMRTLQACFSWFCLDSLLQLLLLSFACFCVVVQSLVFVVVTRLLTITLRP